MNKKGFTLLELIVVLAILGVLSLIILANFNTTIDDATGARCVNDKQELANAYNRELMLNSSTNPEELLIEILANDDHKYFGNDAQCAKQGHLYPIYDANKRLTGFVCSEHDKNNPVLHNAVANKVMNDYHKIYQDYVSGKITKEELKTQSNLFVQKYYETLYGGFPTLTIDEQEYEVYPYIKGLDDTKVPSSLNMSEVVIYAKASGSGLTNDYNTNYIYRLNPGSTTKGTWYHSSNTINLATINNEDITKLINDKQLKKLNDSDILY
ncbi:MAG: type II secretion system protein [Erysipelotrichaceae bacterium]